MPRSNEKAECSGIDLPNASRIVLLWLLRVIRNEVKSKAILGYVPIFRDYCGRWKKPMYTALPRICPCIALIMFVRVSNASVPGWTSTFVSNAKSSNV